MAQKIGLLHQSFYKEKTKGVFNSVTYGSQYFDKHTLVDVLKSSVNHITKDGLLPRNPYVVIYRQLCMDSAEDSLESFFQINQTRGIQLKTRQKKSIEEVRFGQVCLFTSPEFACQIQTKHIMDLEGVIRENRMKLGGQFYQAVCGTELLRSKDVRFGSFGKNRLVFRNYMVLEGGQKAAAEEFSKLVYKAVQDAMNSKETLFKCLVFEPFYGLYQADEIWTRTDIVLYKTKLLNHLGIYPFEGKEISLIYYRKHNGQYYQVKQKFIPILDRADKRTCLDALPLQSYFKGGFLSRQGIEYYLSFFQDQCNNDPNSYYLNQHTYWLIWRYHQHQVEELVWAAYYQIIPSNSDKNGVLQGAVSSVLCGPISEMSHLLVQLETVRFLVETKAETKEIESLFNYTFNGLKQSICKEYNAELHNVKDYVILLCQKAIDSEYFRQIQTARQAELYLLKVLQNIMDTLRSVVLNYCQIVLSSDKGFQIFMKEILSSMKSAPLKPYDVVPFKDLGDVKQKQETSLLGREVERAMEQFQVDGAEAKMIVLTNYYSHTRLKETVYNFISDILFGAKPVNPLTTLLLHLTQSVFEYQFDNPGTSPQLKVPLITKPTKDQKVDQGVFQGIRVFSLKGNLSLYSLTLIKVQAVMRILKIQEKGLTAIFSVSGGYLVEDMNTTRLQQNSVYLDLDLVSRVSRQEACEAFYKVLIQKCRQIQKRRDMGVIGLFKGDTMIKAFDPKNIMTLEQFKSAINCMDKITLKVLFSQKGLRVVNVQLNLHYGSGQWTHLKKVDPFWEWHRVFFQKAHFDLWMQLYPDPKQAYSITADQILDLNLSMKKWLIHNLKQRKVSSDILRNNFEKAFQLSRQSFNYSNLIQYMKNDRTGKFQLAGLAQNFRRHFKAISKMIKHPCYIYNQGCSTTLLHQIQMMEDYLQLHKDNNGEESELCWLQEQYMRMGALLRSTSESILLHYRIFVGQKKQLRLSY